MAASMAGSPSDFLGRRRLGSAIGASLAAAPAAPRAAAAQGAAPGAAVVAVGGEPVPLPGTTQHDLDGADGQPFRVFLHVPPGEPPSGGWPMLTVLDANAAMGQLVDALRVFAFLPRESGVRSAAVLAGIGYRTDGPYGLTRRGFDLTPPPGRDWPAEGGRPAWRSGGADATLDFVEAVVRPLAARAAPIDPGRHALLGHSFGGLFALHALFTRPGMFRDHVAASPAIWWEDDAVLASARRFEGRADRPGPLRLLITAGEYDQALAPWHDPAWEPRMRRMRMVDAARELAERLRPLPGLEVEHRLLAGETHMTSFPRAVHEGLRFVLRA